MGRGLTKTTDCIVYRGEKRTPPVYRHRAGARMNFPDPKLPRLALTVVHDRLQILCEGKIGGDLCKRGEAHIISTVGHERLPWPRTWVPAEVCPPLRRKKLDDPQII